VLVPVVVAVLTAAVLHATWNALVKPAGDRLALLAVMGVASTAGCLALIPLVPVPHRGSWVALGASVALHLGYNLLLIGSYRDGDFNQVYPLARGSAPPLVALGAVLATGERLSPLQTAGLATLSGGLLLLALGGRVASRRAALLALATGCAIATYTVVDGVGVRASGSAAGYAAWLFALSGLTVPLLRLLLAAGGRRFARVPRGLALRGAAAAALSVTAYGLVLWAQTRGALAVVAALRETSVVFAGAIGALHFGEELPVRRIAAGVVVSGGAAVLALG
jgi:drug/metabolite transporter (DMT)-like permease